MTTRATGADIADVTAQYAAVARAYVAAPDERLRDAVYQLGHLAIARKLGLLDLTAIHRNVVLALLAEPAGVAATAEIAQRASELLLEALVPFEMTHRGYQDSIRNLIAANEALKESEAKNLGLLNAIPDAMIRVDRIGTCLDYKAGKDDTQAASAHGCVGRDVKCVMPARVAGRLMKHVEGVLRDGGIAVFEYQREVGERTRDFEIRLAVSGTDEVLGIIRDVTERKRAEEEHAKLAREQAAHAEAQATKERISNILESIADGFMALDAQWRFTYVNRHAERMLHVRREEILDRNLWDVLPDARGSKLEEAFTRAVNERTTTDVKAFNPRLQSWLEAHAYPAKDGLSVYFRDITEQRHHERARLGLARIAQQIAATNDVEQALAMAVGELVASFDVTLAGIWLLHESERTLVLHASAGVSAPGASSRFGRVRIGESRIGEIAAAKRPASSNAIDPTSSPLLPREGGAPGTDAFAGFPLLLADELLGVVGLFRRRPFDEDDLTALATLADQLAVAIEKARLISEVKAALRLREEFIDATSHELRTPVTILKGYTSLLRRNPDATSKSFAKGLRALELGADRVARLARELIEADALERGTLMLISRPQDLGEVARDVLNAAQPEYPNFHFELAQSRALVLVDRERVADVIHHLVENAVKYQPQGGIIGVSVDRAGTEAVLTVRGHGVGIPAERHRHMFEPMYEPIPAGRPGYVGVVGLGLMISKRLVELHGGRIWFESAPGSGSSFHFALPLAPSDGMQAQQGLG